MTKLTLHGAALALGTMLVAPGTGAAAPQICTGRYQVDGGGLRLGGAANDVDAIRITGDGQTGAFSVRLADACTSVAATQAPRTDVFVVRSRFVGCGDLPRFRMRLAFDADCQNLAGRVRSHGEVVTEFTAQHVIDLVSPSPGDPGAPIPTGPLPPDPPAAPSPGTTTPAATPSLTVFSPLAAAVGQTISLFGTNLDRDQTGQPWTGTPPYHVHFAGNPSGLVRATFTFVSANELHVTVPAGAGSGTIRLSQRRSRYPGPAISVTRDRFIVAQPDPPPLPAPRQGTPPATANRGTLTIQSTDQSALTPGTFAVSGAANQAGAFLDLNGNHIVDLGAGRNDVPFLAFPVRTSEFDFTVEQGRGYFAGANAIVWVFFEGGSPAVLDNHDVFVAIHLNVDLTAGTARPVAMIAGVAGSPGVVISTDQFTTANVTVAAPVVGGPGAIRGQLSAVPTFLELILLPSQPSLDGPDFGPELEQRLWANGIVLDFDVPLFNDAQ